MQQTHNLLYYLLLPLSWIYGMIIGIRNRLFDANILKSRSFDIPIICIGNLSVGGTGKTPFSEYIIRLLSKHYKVAVLSRGYKRKTKGFLLADISSTAEEIGDEPFQIKQKFPFIQVAVDSDRCRGIEQLRSGKLKSKVEVIILDDAFQHRYVRAGLNILLTSYNNDYSLDTLLPAGRLREQAHNSSRAQMIVYTKCPKTITPTELRAVKANLNIYPFQQFFVSTIQYGKPYYFFSREKDLDIDYQNYTALLITGIANPAPLEKYLRSKVKNMKSFFFSDHHFFTNADIDKMNLTFETLKKQNQTLVFTTEKDAARLQQVEGLSDEMRKALIVQPIEMSFLYKEKLFNEKIMSYVRENSRNSRISTQ